MEKLKEKDMDHILLAYEHDLSEKIQGKSSPNLDALLGSNPQAASAYNDLKEEFSRLFCNGASDPTMEELQEILLNIQLNGEPFPFFENENLTVNSTANSSSHRDDSPGDHSPTQPQLKDTHALMAFAMLKIRQTVLYNGKDNYVTFQAPQSMEKSIVEREEPALVKPEPPQKLGKWETFANKAFGMYHEEMEAYNRQKIQYEEKLRAYTQQQQQAESKEHYRGVQSSHRTPTSFADLQKKLDDTTPWWHINSKEYKEFLTSLKNVNTLLERGQTDRLLEAYKKLGEAGAQYLQSKGGSHATGLGDLREDLVRNVLDLQQKEQHYLSLHMPDSSRDRQSLMNALHSARSLTIENTGNENTSAIGAATSQRKLFNSPNFKGIFTANKAPFSNLKEMFDSKIASLPQEDLRNLTVPEKEKLSRMFQDMSDFAELTELKTKDQFLSFFQSRQYVSPGQQTQWEEIADSMAACVEAKTEHNQNLTTEDITLIFRDSNKAKQIPSAQFMKDWNDKLTSKNFLIQCFHRKPKDPFPNTLPDKSKVTASVEKFLTDIAPDYHSYMIARNAQISPERRSHLNERNIATSKMAELLGCQDVIAASKEAVLKETNQPGMFMEFVEGISGSDLFDRRIKNDAYSSTSFLENANLKRQACDLQLLDCICGQIDRHPNNIIFQTDPQSGAVVSMKGIDNDMSFGLSGTTNFNGFHSVPLGLIRTVSQKMYNTLDTLSPEIIDYQFMNLLDQKERTALWNRIDTVRQWVHSNKVEIVPDDQWDQKKWEDLALGYKRNDPASKNLFYKLSQAASGLNKYNSENMQKTNQMILEGVEFKPHADSNSASSRRPNRARQNSQTTPGAPLFAFTLL